MIHGRLFDLQGRSRRRVLSFESEMHTRLVDGRRRLCVSDPSSRGRTPGRRGSHGADGRFTLGGLGRAIWARLTSMARDSRSKTFSLSRPRVRSPGAHSAAVHSAQSRRHLGFQAADDGSPARPDLTGQSPLRIPANPLPAPARYEWANRRPGRRPARTGDSARGSRSAIGCVRMFPPPGGPYLGIGKRSNGPRGPSSNRSTWRWPEAW